MAPMRSRNAGVDFGIVLILLLLASRPGSTALACNHSVPARDRTLTMTTALVLAGGGSLGAVEAGMLRALVREGVVADFVVGASVGAVNGAYFAGDPTPEGVARLESLWCMLKREHIFPMGLSSLLGLLGVHGHLVSAQGLKRLLESHLPYRRLEEARVPIHVVATELATGDEVVLSAGSAIDAVLASAAIPGVYPSVTIDGRELVDGGVTNNTPISTAIRLGADRVIVLPTGFACALRKAPASAIGKALHSLSHLVARQLVHDIERFAPRVALCVVPPLCPLDVSPYDYDRSPVLIDRAAESTQAWIAGGGLARSDAGPGMLAPHAH